MGGASGAVRLPPPVGGKATRWPLADPPEADVDVSSGPPADAPLDRPENPIAATAENTAVRANDAATVTRVSLETDRIPASRLRPTLRRLRGR
jgi:hypothetical protein